MILQTKLKAAMAAGVRRQTSHVTSCNALEKIYEATEHSSVVRAADARASGYSQFNIALVAGCSFEEFR